MAHPSSRYIWRLLPVLALHGWLSLLTPAVLAQITPDNTLGAESSRVRTVNNRRDVIEGGAVRGAHLFHSFDAFNVGQDRAAYFANPAGTLNIFSRVTGNSSSNILGTLGVEGTANLYLLNPNGIVFGPNAQLDVAGSFVASTANRLVFDDGQFFSAVASNLPPLLQINVTPGLQYSNNLSATIRNQGNLQVGQNLTLGAQRLDLDGSLAAGRDIVLQGWSRDLGDAGYTVGGYLFTQDLSGQGIDVLIPHENTILANGDVRFTQNYAGESLYVLAGGQVSQVTDVNDITVTGTVGGRITEQIGNGTGGLQFVTVAATDQPTVDIRSGVNWLSLLDELPGNSNISELPVTFGATTGKGIELGNITNHGGNIVLVSARDIVTNNLDTSVSTFSVDEDIHAENGGVITLWADENIKLGNLTSFSSAGSETGDIIGGDGGTILLAAGNNIHVFRIDSSWGSRNWLDFYTTSGNVTGGNGGNVSFAANNNIYSDSIVASSESLSRSRSEPFKSNVIGGNGGTISIYAGNSFANSYSVESLSSSTSFLASDIDSFTGDVTGGDGGDISIHTGYDLSSSSIYSSSSSSSSLFQNLHLDLDSFTGDAIGGSGGRISLTAGNNINIGSIRSRSFSASALYSRDDYSLAHYSGFSTGDVIGGNSGHIFLSADNNINAGSIDSSSDSYSSSVVGDVTGGNAGDIFISAGNNVVFGSISSSWSHPYNPQNWWELRFNTISGNLISGSGGNVFISAVQDINAHSIDASTYSYASSYSFVPTGNVNSGDGGDIALTAGRNIDVDNIGSRSETHSISNSTTGSVVGGDGGNISLIAGRNIITSYEEDVFYCGDCDFFNSYKIDNSSYTESSTGDVIGGNGGEISFVAGIDIINSGSIDSSSTSESRAGNIIGGDGVGLIL